MNSITVTRVTGFFPHASFAARRAAPRTLSCSASGSLRLDVADSASSSTARRIGFVHRPGMPSIKMRGIGDHPALAVQHQGNGDQAGKGQARRLSARPSPSATSTRPSRWMRPEGISSISSAGPAPGGKAGHWRAPALQAPAAIGEPRMLGHMAQFAMHRHGDARPHPAIHLGQLFARRVAGDMDEMILLGQHFHPQRRSRLCSSKIGDFVAGNDAGGEDHRIALAEMDMGMIALGDAGQRRARLALAAGAEIEHRARGRCAASASSSVGGKSFR